MQVINATVHFATELGKRRALTHEETAMLERALVRIPSPYRRWTFADDAKLQRLIRSRMSAAEIATELGRTPWAVYTRIRDLKRKGRR